MDITNEYSATIEEQSKHTDWEEDTKRMDIIGQNGNDGLHYKEDKKDVIIKEKIIREYIKLPKELEAPFNETIKHMRRRGEKIPKIKGGLFED